MGMGKGERRAKGSTSSLESRKLHIQVFWVTLKKLFLQMLEPEEEVEDNRFRGLNGINGSVEAAPKVFC